MINIAGTSGAFFSNRNFCSSLWRNHHENHIIFKRNKRRNEAGEMAITGLFIYFYWSLLFFNTTCVPSSGPFSLFRQDYEVLFTNYVSTKTNRRASLVRDSHTRIRKTRCFRNRQRIENWSYRSKIFNVVRLKRRSRSKVGSVLKLIMRKCIQNILVDMIYEWRFMVHLFVTLLGYRIC